MAAPVITLKEVTFPDVTGKTIRIFGTLATDTGNYATGGVAAGLKAFLALRTLDVKGILDVQIKDPNVVAGNQITYNYIPASDLLQVFSAGVEATNAAPIPNNSHVLNFVATLDRTTVKG